MLASTADSDEETKLKNLNTFSAILLGIFTITAFVTNIFLLTTIASSYYLRNTVFYYHALHLACINLAHTAVNSLLSMLYVSTGEWKLGNFACGLNAFMGELLAVETMYGVTLMTLDRAIALLSISKYETRMTPLRTIIALAGCWLIGVVITFPVLIGTIEAVPYPARFFCSVTNNPLGYPIATFIICYVFPLLIIFWSIGVVLFRMHKDRVRRRAMLPDRFGDYTDFIVDNRRVQKHMELAKYSVITFIIYYVLQGPYYTFKFFHQIRNSAGARENYGSYLETPADAETTIALLYSLFLVVFPLLTFCYAKDIWKKFQDLICCRKTNVVSTTVVSSGTIIGAPAVRVTRPNEEVHTTNVVTIMPTSDGIHQIRPGRDEPEYADVPRRQDSHMNDGARRSGRSQKTDGGTSDYDSEDSDTFEEANPDNLYKNKSNVTAQVYKTELIDGAMRKTRFEIDSSAQIRSGYHLSVENKPSSSHMSVLTPTTSQSEVQLQNSENNVNNSIVSEQNHQRSRSESEPKSFNNDNEKKRPKRKSLDETLIGVGGKLPTLSRRSSVRLLNPGAVPSPVNAVRNKSSNGSVHPRLPPIPTAPVPNMPDNRLSTDNFELKPSSSDDSKTTKAADDASAENKKRKTSAVRPKRKT